MTKTFSQNSFNRLSNFKQRYFWEKLQPIAPENPTKVCFRTHATFSCNLHKYSKVPSLKKEKKKNSLWRIWLELPQVFQSTFSQKRKKKLSLKNLTWITIHERFLTTWNMLGKFWKNIFRFSCLQKETVKSIIYCENKLLHWHEIHFRYSHNFLQITDEI